MNSTLALLESHTAKIGIGGTIGTFTLTEWNLLAGLSVATLTGLALLPVIVVRWVRLFRGRDPERDSNPPFKK
jgi:hypothetical protein